MVRYAANNSMHLNFNVIMFKKYFKGFGKLTV